MQELSSILLHVYPADSDLLVVAEYDESLLCERTLVLADLISFRQIRIKVVLSIKVREQRYFAIEGETDHDTTLDCLLIWYWQRTGKS
jgi:hypothetical protein